MFLLKVYLALNTPLLSTLCGTLFD